MGYPSTTHENAATAPTMSEWAEWHPSTPYTVGIEEEVMLLDPENWSLAQRVDEILPILSPRLAAQVTAETHNAALELATSPHGSAADAAAEAATLRRALHIELADAGLAVASAGTHPFTDWTKTQISSGARYQLVYGSMRELARREPTFALHVHIGVADPEAAITLHNRLRAHLPLLLALSVNSPFWQGRATGLLSSRIPLFQAFPRVGIPRAFTSYTEYVETVDVLLRSGAFPEPTFLWWDIRPQPRFGTVEVRIMDAQTGSAQTAALAALVQTLAYLELEHPYVSDKLIGSPEILDENRFLAARDGFGASLIDPLAERRVPVADLLDALLDVAYPYALELGSAAALQMLGSPLAATGAEHQIEWLQQEQNLPGLVSRLSERFVSAQ